MQRPDSTDARFQLLAAVCQFAAGNHSAALEASERAANGLADEAIFLAGWAHLLQGNDAAARTAFAQTANNEHSPSRGHAQALLGKIAFDHQKFEQAVGWWKRLEGDK